MNKGYPHSGRLAILVAIGALAFAACSAPSSPHVASLGRSTASPTTDGGGGRSATPGLGRRNQASGPVGCLHA